MTPPDEADEAATRGGYRLPPNTESGEFVGPPDDPDRYELVGTGTAGGEGITWPARYRGRLQAPLPLAVKQLFPPPGAGPNWPSEAERRRWQDQAALIRHLRLEHLVRVYEVFAGAAPHQADKGGAQVDQYPYLVMEWVEGLTLRDLCRDKPAGQQTIKDLLGYVQQAAATLSELASATRSAGNPSLHRDIKPANCIINDERGLVLIDVSTLRLIEDGFDAAGMHTPPYTAPEVLAAPHLPRTAAADVYSLGALAFFCLTGRDPEPEPDPEDRHRDLVTAAGNAGVADPAALAAHIMMTLEQDPRRRPADLSTWGDRLIALGRVPRSRTLPILVAAAVATAVAALAGAVVLWGGPGADRDDGSVVPPPSASASLRSSSEVRVPVGSITAPVDRAEVKQCSYFSGTSSLPTGTTLVLAMQNLVNGDSAQYAEVVFGWDHPERLSTWRGAQYFGNNDDTVGQRYRVRLIAVALDSTRVWDQGRGLGDPGTKLVAGGVVLDEVQVDRIAGQVGNACVGPP